MARSVITVDGKTLLDADLYDWQQPSPEILKYIKPGAKPPTYMRAAIIALAEAAAQNQIITISVTTRDGGWTMSSDHALALTS